MDGCVSVPARWAPLSGGIARLLQARLIAGMLILTSGLSYGQTQSEPKTIQLKLLSTQHAAKLELGAVSSGETVHFIGANAGTLQLDKPAAFMGALDGSTQSSTRRMAPLAGRPAPSPSATR